MHRQEDVRAHYAVLTLRPNYTVPACQFDVCLRDEQNEGVLSTVTLQTLASFKLLLLRERDLVLPPSTL